MATPVSPRPQVQPPSSATKDKCESPPRAGAAVEDRPEADSAAGGRAGLAAVFTKGLLRRVLREVGNPPIRVALWDGQEIAAHCGPATDAPPPVALVRIRDRRTLLGLLVNPEFAFGDAYTDGRIEIEGDLLEFLETMYRAMWPAAAPRRRLWKRAAEWLSWLHTNTISRSRRNVHHHYDIKDEFYRLWLDEQMVYTCAYFSDPAMSIEEAQRAKMGYVCRKLRLRRGETVLEAGFGWGSLALHMVRHYGVRVRAYNLSHEQTLFARQRAKAEGLASQVEFIEDDYRNVSGKFDVFVSVGMLEHVGREHYRRLGQVIDRSLKPEGRGLVHSIGRNRPARLDGWTDRRIFPGAYPPSLKEMMDVFEPYGLSVLDVENLRLHYAKTLEHWLARYRAHEARVAEMFDQRFVRMWRLYLAGSMAAFRTGTLQLFQIVFARGAVNQIPWTRAWLYADR